MFQIVRGVVLILDCRFNVYHVILVSGIIAGTGEDGWKVDVYNVAFWNSLVGVLVVFRGL